MKKAKIDIEDRLDIPKKELLFYMGGFLGQNLSYNLIVSWALIFYTTVLGMDGWLCGLILGICKIIDAFTDIIAGSLMDKHRFKNGEKLRPYLKFIPIPIGIFAMLIFLDLGLTNNWLAVYLFAVYLLWDFFYSIHDVALWGMSAIISSTDSGRNKIAQWARIACMIGSWLPGLIPLFLGNREALGLSEKQIYFTAAILFGLGGMLIATTASKANERVRSKSHTYTFKQMMNGIAKNKILLYMVIANIITGISVAVPGIYFYKYMVNYNFSLFGMPMNGLNVMFLSGIIAAIPGSLIMLIATKVARKVGGMKNIILLSCFLNIGLRLLSFIIGYESWRMIILILFTMIINIPTSLVSIANTSLWGDAVNYHEYKTGDRNEGLVFACQNLTGKASNGLSTIILGGVLSAIGFNEKLYENDLPQGQLFNKWIWAIFILGPILGSILQAIPMLMLKYSEKERKEVERVIKERRNAIIEN